MTSPTRIRALAKGGNATVRMQMAHDMEGGHRKDASGQTIPAWFIQEVTATHNGRTVLSAEWGPTVSRNPFLQFVVKGARAGDTIAIAWRDNQGETRSDQAVVV